MTPSRAPTARPAVNPAPWAGPLIACGLALALAWPGVAWANKMAVVPLRAGAGAKAALAGSLSDVVVAELRRNAGVEILTSEEISAILGHESDKAMLGCDEISCLADLGGALGADELLAGSVAKLGTSWILHLKRIDVKEVKVVAQVDRRFKGGSIDDLLDALPAMTKELLAGAPLAASGGVAAAAAAAPSAPVSVGPIGSATKPSPVQEVPLKNPKEGEGLVLFSDGQGRYLAHNPALLNRSPVFFGDANKLYKQRTQSTGRSGKGSYSITVWAPRFSEGYKRQFYVKDGVSTRRCGDVKTVLQPVPAAKAAKILAGAKLLEQRWVRGVTFFAMDSEPRYYVLDKALEPRNSQDYRLYVGAKGALRFVEVTDVSLGSGKKGRYVTAEGQLAVDYKVTTWTPKGGAAIELQVLSHFSRAKDIYTAFGTYDEKMLGTICDPPL